MRNGPPSSFLPLCSPAGPFSPCRASNVAALYTLSTCMSKMAQPEPYLEAGPKAQPCPCEENFDTHHQTLTVLSLPRLRRPQARGMHVLPRFPRHASSKANLALGDVRFPVPLVLSYEPAPRASPHLNHGGPPLQHPAWVCLCLYVRACASPWAFVIRWVPPWAPTDGSLDSPELISPRSVISANSRSLVLFRYSLKLRGGPDPNSSNGWPASDRRLYSCPLPQWDAPAAGLPGYPEQ